MRDMDPSDSWEPYVAAIYWAFTTMTTVSIYIQPHIDDTYR